MEASYREDPLQYPQFAEPNQRTSAAIFTFLYVGLGKVAGGIITGQIIDKASIKAASFVILCVTGLGVAFLIAFTLSKKWGFLAYLLCFAWGWQDASINIILNTILGF